MATIDTFFEDILKKEGGFQNDTKDNGNWTGGKTGVGKLVGTNLGITAPVLAKWRGVKASTITEEDIKNLKPEEAKAIYEKKYFLDTGINKLPEEIQGNVLDMAINSGPSRAIKLFQKAAGVAQTGVIDEKTIEVAPTVSNNIYADSRSEFYKSLITKNPDKYKRYEKGWMKRADSFRMKPEVKTSEQQIPYPVTPQGVEMSPFDIRNYRAERDVRNYSGMEPGIQEALLAEQKPEYVSMEELLGKRGGLSNPFMK